MEEKFHLQQALRKHAKIKMALQGPSGSGKTMGALLIALGLCNNWNKIAVIDTENHSSELYAHLGNYQVLHLDAPFNPERYVEAIQTCENAGIEVIIIDSISPVWEGMGGILEVHAGMAGNSYTNWSKLTPRHNTFVQRLLQSPAHIVGTLRAKQEYVLTDKNGKQVPEKVGMKPISREGLDYEFTLVIELDVKNNATATKDRTSLFTGKPEFKLTAETGKKIFEWCNQGEAVQKQDLTQRISECKSMEELLKLFYANPTDDASIKNAFSNKKAILTHPTLPPLPTISNTQNLNNGTSNHTNRK